MPCNDSERLLIEVLAERVQDALAEVERLQEAEAHLWAMVVHLGGRGYSPYVQRDVNAASRYVNEHLAELDMTTRHRAALDAFR